MSSESDSSAQPYRVLALKYRPQNFSELIGQDALVRTLKNAIDSGRIAHAFMLTGVRGVGKTTTARIIAKALNYKGPDGSSNPTTGPTDDCDLCQAISEDRHPDVIEMDAASRTGVEDIREILDGVRYAPTEARYKIYIIDEVHMLSKSAFNALLKTLEEPPPHVKFIFATTEIRKVPVTVLSRCQRFDLRRVDTDTLMGHFKNICDQEEAKIDDEALGLIARAADGSVRDGLSILDQAITLSGKDITGQQVQDMLGLSDRAKTIDLLEHGLRGEMPDALAILDGLYKSGADPVTLMQDLLDITHLLTRFRAVPQAKEMKQALPAEQIERLGAMATNLSMPTLGRAWQIFLKGLSEVSIAPSPQNAAEMVLIRLAYAADLPDPADLIKKLDNQEISSAPNAAPPPAPQGSPSVSEMASATPTSAPPTQSASTQSISTAQGSSAPATSAALAHDQEPHDEQVAITEIKTIEDVVCVLEQAQELVLASHVAHYVHLVKLQDRQIEFVPAADAPTNLASNMTSILSKATGERWIVTITQGNGAPTLAQKRQQAEDQILDDVKAHPIISEILETFPGAEIIDIKDHQS